MKSLKSILSFVLIAVILAANSKYAIGKMTCLHSGNVEVNFGKAVMCDTDETTADEVSEPCCDLQNYNLSPDDHFNSSIVKVLNTVSFTLFYSVFNKVEFAFLKFSKNNFDLVSDTGPPPKIKFSPSFLSIFRI